MTKFEEILKNQNENMCCVKDTWVVNDFNTIIYNEIGDNEFCLGVTAITDNDIVYRGIANGSNFSYITQILDSIPHISSLKLICCSKNKFESEDSRREILTLIDNNFRKYKPSNIELKQSSYIMIDQLGIIDYDNKEELEEQNKRKK